MQLRAGDPESIGGYPLEARLGSGGMGTVFLARTASGRPVAVKLIHRQFVDDDEFRTRFRQEVRAARRVSGAFTAAVVDADTDGDHPWMATTYISGPTLAQRIADDGPLGGAELRRLAIGLAEALRDIHRAGVVHRDLKPSNVVLSPEGPRVIDFGISRADDHQTLTMTGRVIGTPPFMSPEQLQAPRDVRTASDVFSLATLLVYAATGQGPFDADSPYMTAYQVVHEAPTLDAVPGWLRDVVEPCLAKAWSGRPTADDLLVQLHALPERPAGPEPSGAVAAAPAEPVAPTPPTHENPLVSGEDAGGRRAARRFGARWRTTAAVALAVAAISTGVAQLVSGGGGQEQSRAAAKDQDTLAVRATPSALPAPPAGFRPWRLTLRGAGSITDEVRCVPSGDSVYCGGGGVVASRLRAVDGSEVWKRTSPGVPVLGLHMVGVSGGTVIGYRIGAEGTAEAGAEEIVAFSADDGRQLWTAGVGTRSNLLTGQPRDAVLVGSTVLSVNSAGTRIEARQAHTGTLRWTAPFPTGSLCAPLPAGERVLAVCTPAAEAGEPRLRHLSYHLLDVTTGALGKAVDVAGPVRPMGAVDGSLVLLREHTQGAGVTGYDRLLLLDPRTGRTTSSPLAWYGNATAGMAGGTLYFATATGLVAAVDPATGRERWSRQTAVETASGPTLANGVVYFSSISGRVVALDQRSGRLLWNTDPRADTTLGSMGESPRVAVDGGVLVVAAGENTVFAFDASEPPKAR